MATEITHLPVEMTLKIFNNLSLHQLVINCSKVCVHWKDMVAQFVLGPKLLKLARFNGAFKKAIVADGWTEEVFNSSDLILSLYEKYEKFTRK